jgi:hypothetical protein
MTQGRMNKNSVEIFGGFDKKSYLCRAKLNFAWREQAASQQKAGFLCSICTVLARAFAYSKAL